MFLPSLVVFDLDDTLLDHKAAERAALADLRDAHDGLRRHALEHVQETYHACNAPLWADFAAGTITSSDLKRRRWTDTLVALECADLEADAASADYLARYGCHWRWAEGARDAYLAVAAEYPVAILTNGFSAQQRGKLARFPDLEAAAVAVVISDEVDVMKPDPRVFEHVHREAQSALEVALAPADILYVGDSLRSDVRGGVGAGWRVAWKDGNLEVAPDGVEVFSDWAELLRLLEI
ncbi:HAD family hydrolase [Rubrivirga sp.]|uniref:HAD family hydrolase n=1 Tax=Rubrivirga sp. TaxID=1885344 RepID=UPI003C766BA1